jgi:hypothetical protein
MFSDCTHCVHACCGRVSASCCRVFGGNASMVVGLKPPSNQHDCNTMCNWCLQFGGDWWSVWNVVFA